MLNARIEYLEIGLGPLWRGPWRLLLRCGHEKVLGSTVGIQPPQSVCLLEK